MTVSYPLLLLLLVAFALAATLILARARRARAAETAALDDAIEASRAAREDERWRDAYRTLADLRLPPPPSTP